MQPTTQQQLLQEKYHQRPLQQAPTYTQQYLPQTPSSNNVNNLLPTATTTLNDNQVEIPQPPSLHSNDLSRVARPPPPPLMKRDRPVRNPADQSVRTNNLPSAQVIKEGNFQNFVICALLSIAEVLYPSR